MITPSGDRIPVEVVDAYERMPNEDPGTGSTWVPVYKQAEREASAQERVANVPVAFGAHEGKGFTVPLEGSQQMPLRMSPVDPVSWVLAAVLQKIAKNYSGRDRTVLAVRLVNWDSLLDWELDELGRTLDALACPFCDVWILNEFGKPPQRVPRGA